MPRSTRRPDPAPAEQPAMEVNGWTIHAHPQFLAQLEKLRSEVQSARTRNPAAFRQGRPAKLLAAILKLALEEIPGDPGAPQHRQGESLGSERKHWFRAKFYQQYRLFYRFDTASRIIVLAWVNDEATKRAYGSKTDGYAVVRKMLERNDPPDDWRALLGAASGKMARRRFAGSRSMP
ncbi:MAG: type II toxin-antitoxin system YhaV family toxin [Caulobacteraceae bacterium]